MPKITMTKEAMQYHRGLGNLKGAAYFLLLSTGLIAYGLYVPSVWGTYTTFISQVEYSTIVGCSPFLASTVDDSVPIPLGVYTSDPTVALTLTYPSGFTTWGTVFSNSDLACGNGTPVFEQVSEPNGWCDPNTSLLLTQRQLLASQGIGILAGFFSLLACGLSCEGTRRRKPPTPNFKPAMARASSFFACCGFLFALLFCIVFPSWAYITTLLYATSSLATETYGGNALVVLTRDVAGNQIFAPLIVTTYLGPGWGLLFTCSLMLLAASVVLFFAGRDMDLNVEYIVANFQNAEDDLAEEDI